MWESKEAKLVIHIDFFCSKFMGCLELRFWPHAVQIYERWDSKNSIVNWFDSCYTYKVPKFTKHGIGFNHWFYWRRWLIWGDQLRYSFKYISYIIWWFKSFPHTFKFRSHSSCFFFLIMRATSILATSREILLAFNHQTRNIKVFIYFKNFVYLFDWVFNV